MTRTQTWLEPATYELVLEESQAAGQSVGEWLREAVERRLELDAALRALAESEGAQFRPLDE